MVDGLTKNKEESSKSLDVTLRQIYKIKKNNNKSKTYPSCLFIYLLPVRILSASSSMFTRFFFAMRPMIHLERPYC